MKENRGYIIAAVVIIALAVVWYFNRTGSSSGGPSAQPSASAPALVTKKFAREGLSFEYPDNYRVEVATDDPNLHQIAIDSASGPGVLTLRYNPSNPASALDLDTIVSQAKQGIGDGVEATVKPTRLRAAGKDVDGRELKSAILGFPFTDNIFDVQVGPRHFAVLTHVADEDKDKAKVMFDKVLSTLSVQ